jgi:hypothetical protein
VTEPALVNEAKERRPPARRVLDGAVELTKILLLLVVPVVTSFAWGVGAAIFAAAHDGVPPSEYEGGGRAALSMILWMTFALAVLPSMVLSLGTLVWTSKLWPALLVCQVPPGLIGAGLALLHLTT